MRSLGRRGSAPPVRQNAAMGPSRAVVVAAGLVTGLVGCGLLESTPNRVVHTECREADVGIEIGAPLSAQECQEVLELVVSRSPSEDPELGTLLIAVAQLLADCVAEGRDAGVPELTDPGVDRCWRVSLQYAAGGRGYLAARDEETGRIGLYECAIP